MPKKEYVKEKIRWMEYIKILICGVVFGIIAYMLTGGVDPVGNVSGTVSIIVGLLIIYLEYKFMKLEKVKK